MGNADGIVPVHRRSHQNGLSFWYILSFLFRLLLPWQLLGRYGASSSLMAASSGFRSSPGHTALGDALCIALADRHGHQNGQQWRNMLMAPSSLSSTSTVVAKDHAMVH
jgi:hypothetical protein